MGQYYDPEYYWKEAQKNIKDFFAAHAEKFEEQVKAAEERLKAIEKK